MQLHGVFLRAGKSSDATMMNGVMVGITAYTHVDLRVVGVSQAQAVRIKTDLTSMRPKVNLAVGWYGQATLPYYSPLQQTLMLSCIDPDVVNGLLRRGVLNNSGVLYRYGVRTVRELEQAYGR